MIYFSIKDLERFSGIKAHTIRTWEQRFSFLQPKRTEGLRRTYDCAELRLLLNISFLNRNGYKVSHIARMTNEEMNALLAVLSDLDHQQQKAVNDLICSMTEMNTENFNLVLQRCELAWGIDVTLSEVILPFCQKTGLLKQKEQKKHDAHLLSVEQSLKQKIILGIENAGTSTFGKSALFFLCKKKSETELLYLQYELKISGFTILYISSPVTFSQLCAIAMATKPAYIITSAGGKNQQIDIKKLVGFINENLVKSTFLNLEDNGPLPFKNLQMSKEVFAIDTPEDILQ